MMNKNKDRGLIFIILGNIIFTLLYYYINRADSLDKLYVIPIISIVILFQYIIFRSFSNKLKNIDIIKKYYYKVLISSTALLIFIQFTLLYNYFDTEVDSYKIISLAISYMLIYIGNIMPQIKQNSIIGVRTKRALNDEMVWKSANRVGGISLVIVGVILFIVSLIMKGKLLIVVLLIGIVIWSLINDIYLRWYFKRKNIS